MWSFVTAAAGPGRAGPEQAWPRGTVSPLSLSQGHICHCVSRAKSCCSPAPSLSACTRVSHAPPPAPLLTQHLLGPLPSQCPQLAARCPQPTLSALSPAARCPQPTPRCRPRLPHGPRPDLARDPGEGQPGAWLPAWRTPCIMDVCPEPVRAGTGATRTGPQRHWTLSAKSVPTPPPLCSPE